MKYINFWNLCLIIWLSIGDLCHAQSQADLELNDDEKLIEFTTDRFTLPSLHVTPDKKHIIFDVIGDIYQVPIEGGKAEVLLQDSNWKRAGKLSPDGKTLAYISDETGLFQVWTYNIKTKEKQVYPTVEDIHYALYPFWDSENNLIIADKKGILRYNLLTKEEQNIRPTPKDERSIIAGTALLASIDKGGENAYIQKNNQLYVFNLKSGKEHPLKLETEIKKWIHHYRVNKENNKLIGIESSKGNNIFFMSDLNTGKKENIIKLSSLGTNVNIYQGYDFLDENNIIIEKDGQINKMNLTTKNHETIPIRVKIKKRIKRPLQRSPQSFKDSIITAKVLRNPTINSDSDTIYFAAFGKLHSYSKRSRIYNEIYPDKDRFEIAPSLSPNNRYLAFSTWNDKQKGHIYVKEIETGKEFKVTKKAGRYFSPTWTPNGKDLIYLSDETKAKDNQIRYLSIGSHPSDKSTLFKAHLSVRKKFKVKSISKIGDFKIFSVLPKRYFSGITFHQAKPHLFIPTFNEKKLLAELVELDLDSKQIINELPIPNYIDEVLVSPDAEHVAFVHDEQVWIDSYPFIPKYNFSPNSDIIPKKYHVNGGYVENISLPNSKSIYEVAPSYLYWQNENTLMWGSADEIYTYDLRIEKAQRIADIKVQKPRAVPKTKYALTDARIITMNNQDEIIERGTILINRNRIEKVGIANQIKIPEDYSIIDLKGKTIIPGLIDVHAHYLISPHEVPYQENYIFHNNLAYGITSIYDPSVNALDYKESSQLVETGVIIGPRLFASGNIIMRSPEKYDFKNIQNEDDAERIIKSNKKLGVHGPIKDYSLSNRKIRQWLRAEAKKYDMTITPDQANYMEAMTRIIDGYSSIEHLLSSFPLQKDILNLVSKSKIGYTPTLIVNDFFTVIQAGKNNNKPICDRRKLFYGSKEMDQGYEYEKTPCEEILTNSLLGKNDKHENEIYGYIDSIKEIIEKGGNVSVGAHGNFTIGLNTHWELWALTLTGLDNYEALRAATINGAKKLSLQNEIGSVEKNKLADLVILDDNPLENIFNTTHINHTIMNGSIFTIER